MWQLEIVVESFNLTYFLMRGMTYLCANGNDPTERKRLMMHMRWRMDDVFELAGGRAVTYSAKGWPLIGASLKRGERGHSTCLQRLW